MTAVILSTGVIAVIRSLLQWRNNIFCYLLTMLGNAVKYSHSNAKRCYVVILKERCSNGNLVCDLALNIRLHITNMLVTRQKTDYQSSSCGMKEEKHQ
jgi:hypothetical protein